MAQGVKRINPPGMKYCVRCEETKPLDEFGKSAQAHDGKFTYCRLCVSARNQARAPEARRNAYLQRKYGITLVEYERLYEEQGGVCAICKQGPTKPTRGTAEPTFVVDHDHNTGAVRGLLCGHCNTGIGLLRDSPEVLGAAIS